MTRGIIAIGTLLLGLSACGGSSATPTPEVRKWCATFQRYIDANIAATAGAQVMWVAVTTGPNDDVHAGRLKKACPETVAAMEAAAGQ